MENVLCHLPGPESLASPSLGWCLGELHTSFQKDGLFISASQFLPHQLEFSEQVKTPTRSSSFSIIIRCCSQIPGPLSSCSLSKMHFSQRLPLCKCQAGFSHCSPTENAMRGGLEPCFILLGNNSQVNWRTILSMHYKGGMELSCLWEKASRLYTK